MKVGLILLNWNNAADTLACLTSLAEVTYPDFFVVVVDNGSTDDSFQKIRTAFPRHHFLENRENLGYAEGNNRGLAKAAELGADLLLLLNNDTEVAPGFLTHIVDAAKRYPNAGVLGPKIYLFDDPATIWYAGGSVDPKTGRCYHIGYGAFEGHNEERETDFICGCALAIRKEVYAAVGGMGSEFFLIWEEIDWCYRIRAAGYACIFVPKAKIWHKVSASFTGGNRGPMWQYFYHRNRLLFHKRHRVGKGLPIGELWALFKGAFHPEHRSRCRAALTGIKDYYLGRFGKASLSKFTH